MDLKLVFRTQELNTSFFDLLIFLRKKFIDIEMCESVLYLCQLFRRVLVCSTSLPTTKRNTIRNLR
jgi:hypothetical protein